MVLLSAGLDSSFNLFKASKEMQILLALTFDYGQRAASQEIAKAAGLSARLGIAHKVIALPWFKDFTRTSLLGGAEVPMANQVSIDDHQRSLQTAKAVWVPNRNGILLNIAAGFAEGLGADFIVPVFWCNGTARCLFRPANRCQGCFLAGSDWLD